MCWGRPPSGQFCAYVSRCLSFQNTHSVLWLGQHSLVSCTPGKERHCRRGIGDGAVKPAVRAAWGGETVEERLLPGERSGRQRLLGKGWADPACRCPRSFSPGTAIRSVPGLPSQRWGSRVRVHRRVPRSPLLGRAATATAGASLAAGCWRQLPIPSSVRWRVNGTWACGANLSLRNAELLRVSASLSQ